MKIQIDTYSKIILTIIALCLVWICLQGVKLFPFLYAGNHDVVDVRIRAIEREVGQDWDSIIVSSLDNLPVEVRNTMAVPVEVRNELLPVDVKNVHVKSTLIPFEEKK